MNDLKGISQYPFKDSEEYKDFLKKEMALLNKDQEYNIYVHQVCSYTYSSLGSNWGMDDEQRIKNRLNGILSSSLSLDDYGSINGTSRFLGSSKDEGIVDKIFDYNYENRMGERTSCIIAYPKYITIDGEKYEFSSYDGKSSYTDKSEDGLQAYYKKNTGSFQIDHHAKYCLFDAIKGFEKLPKEYFLGAQIIDEQKGKFIFIDTKRHLTQIPKSERKLFEHCTEEKVKEAMEEAGSKDIGEVIVKSYKKEMEMREHSAAYDFDFD